MISWEQFVMLTAECSRAQIADCLCEVYDCMTTELFEDEQGQAVRLPEACRFKGEEVVIGKVDELVVLAPKDSKWASFLETFAMLSNEDF